MSTPIARLLTAFETHDAPGIIAALDDGVSIDAPIDRLLPVDHLITMYYRSDAFTGCLRILLERGATVADPLLRAVLLNDIHALEDVGASRADLMRHRVTLPCTFTPLDDASLLHVAAEYGHLDMTAHLLSLGVDVDARAGTDADGMNGQTPLFHTVNSNRNRSLPVMQQLLGAGARTDVRLDGITWGRGFDWATVCFDVTPVSYAQCGLLPQMHRTEQDTYETIRVLLDAARRQMPSSLNVPNRYLRR